ncbi:interleukin-13 receptor subunit alpha-1-like [Heteronotia binoei]|uniref:interleukin-13 receptor subunit alpha-1-like n=1 Tax=Heteronotia binoei TaxID=13085 RepID=UPI00292DD603|nr:interleukin-13 receptor subunit alpha-1-like [Heteronotia binoei]
MGTRALLLLACAGAVARGVLFARPPNVTYSIDEKSCSLHITWMHVQPPNSNCTRHYHAVIYVEGKKFSKQCKEENFWKEKVPLNKKIDFDIKTSCRKLCTDLSPWNGNKSFHVERNGAADTGARNANCVLWNRNYMKCSWQAGEKASPDSSYRLFYSHDSNSGQQCRNLTREGSDFRCGFVWIHEHVQLIAISILGNSGNVQPLCLLERSINNLVKYDPPKIKNLSKHGSEVFLQWTKPDKLYAADYEVKVNSKVHNFTNSNDANIPVEPDALNTFQVRVKATGGLWSDWSEMEVIDSRPSTFSLLLLVLIPSCLALLLVVLLIYLKRIKLLILPKIPDPEKILKHMFEEQNENQPTHEAANNEETHSLMIVEPAGNEK